MAAVSPRPTAWSRSFTNCLIAWSTFSVEAGADVAEGVGEDVGASGLVAQEQTDIVTAAMASINTFRLIWILLSVVAASSLVC
jgi:hypothetical protein